ncbi:MAG: RIP metalloprotease RseP [Candidatus Eisenbacteria bacterium]|nr:RIP metalloprotease RseP [Candidatus Eisenbacteria bacterium]
MTIFYLYAAVLVGILIVVHELGHFAAARAAGVTVERFSVGFGPRILRFRRGETEYAVSLIPLGGYVKMAGHELADGSDAGAAPGSFLSKPVGARALIVAAGPTMNFVWAVLVSFAVIWGFGLPTLGGPVVGSVTPGSPADAAGLSWGDRIISVDGAPVSHVAEVYARAAEAGGRAMVLVIERGDEARERLSLELAAPADSAGVVDLGMTSYVAPVIGDVMKKSPADAAGLRRGDRVLSVAGAAVRDWGGLGEAVRARAGEETEVVWERDGRVMRSTVVPKAGVEDRAGEIGVMSALTLNRLGPWESFTTAVRYCALNVRLLAQFFWDLVRLRASTETLGGPIRVVQMASESARWGPMYFLGFMSYLSLSLFFINLLPLPVLDGGHLLLLGLEKARRRRLTERQVLVWQQVGLVFFGCLMVLLVVKDVMQLR